MWCLFIYPRHSLYTACYSCEAKHLWKREPTFYSWFSGLVLFYLVFPITSSMREECETEELSQDRTLWSRDANRQVTCSPSYARSSATDLTICCLKTCYGVQSVHCCCVLQRQQHKHPEALCTFQKVLGGHQSRYGGGVWWTGGGLEQDQVRQGAGERGSQQQLFMLLPFLPGCIPLTFLGLLPVKDLIKVW